MPICEHCKSTIRELARFCPQCGKSVAEGLIPKYSWQIEVPLIGNRFIIRNVTMGILASLALWFVIVGGIFGYAGGWDGVYKAFLFMLGLGIFLFLISIFTLTVVLGNRYQMEFMVGQEGMQMISRSARARKAHRLALLAGLLARNLAAAGAGLSAMSTETQELEWSKAVGLTLYPKAHAIAIKRRFLPSIHLFCTAANYAEVSAYIYERIERK